MEAHCQIPNAIEKIFAASHCGVAYMGGSLTAGVGASNVAETSWRALFTKYLYREYHPVYHCQASEIMGAIGACESYVAAFTLERNVLPSRPDLAFIEFCVNDRGAPDRTLVQKGLEGIVRQLRCGKNPCDVIIVGMGTRQRNVDHSLHRAVADHYDLPFVDVQSYIFNRLEAQGQTWDDVDIEFETNDPCHMNDYGNQLSFEAIRECFEEQVRLFKAGKRRERNAPVPAPLVSDELQFAGLVDPSKKNRDIQLEGSWTLKDKGRVPWYFDNLLVGTPGSSLTFTFEGTAIAVYGLMYHNGLKVEAELDGKPIAGPYLKHFIEFGKGLVLAHGLPLEKHVLKLTVAEASSRHNKLENPTAELGYLGVATGAALAAEG